MGQEAVIFDLDGTLWDSVKNVVIAWNRVIERSGISERMTEEQMRGYMGKTIEQIAEAFVHSVPKQQALEIMKECCRQEAGYLSVHGGKLYPKLEETLQQLSSKYLLAIVSNCQPGYIESFLVAHQMQKYFTDWECYGATGKPKGDNIRRIIEHNGVKKAVYVGDTQADFEACKQANVPFIHAAYGFGKIDAPVTRIQSPAELLALTDRLFSSGK